MAEEARIKDEMPKAYEPGKMRCAKTKTGFNGKK